ncbi:RNA pseudouridine synthase [Thalassotalea sp. M1531]|uniref:RNA pseudouridine synthase n=1 Tax=Thalassotalea algicola TaxID=2716224 RepID=A0A7Y0LC65_9GAMM|nr:RluA family pseudouridine synthase [Thalassotalea algicola]NMP30385.1 RNA pseudouridine synthase [Thalassotalea algicola]
MLSSNSATCFTPFTSDSSNFSLPTKFTYPFCYQPHPLSRLAADQLKQQLSTFHPLSSNQKGRMYGVLVVQKANGELGYLTALSGKHSEELDTRGQIQFVPPVFDVNEEDPYFVEQQATVNRINKEINDLQQAPVFNMLQVINESEQAAAAFQIARLQAKHVVNRKQRKAKRQWLSQALDHKLTETNINEQEAKQISIGLSRESVEDKRAITDLKSYWQARIAQAEQKLIVWQQKLAQLQKTRRKLSSSLQKRLFKQYQLLNGLGNTKNLVELFAETITPTPPAGSGDCAAPKLLQYAYQHELTPVCMAEFWWGRQPESEIRKHQQYYPACQGKCLPILSHMLEGIALEDNPLLVNPATNKSLDIIYQDEHLVVVNKPEGMLSVPGKNIVDSVASRVKQMFPMATGNLVLHRLDMATSGLLVLALNERAHKHLQKQFISKIVQKRYIAIVDGVVSTSEGEINLPLTLDINDRPRQMVCFDHGKTAKTKWQLIEHKAGRSRLWLYPITGRTHQLRVHCAHPEGLNISILGDGLYGTSANRLHLHAQQLSFLHPVSQQRITFEAEPNF